jgi:hypothetical protein
MITRKNIIVFWTILFAITVTDSIAQKSTIINKTLIFSTIKASVSKSASLLLPPVVKTVKIVSGDIASFKIISFQHGNLSIAFTPAADLANIVKAKIEAKNAAGELVARIDLTGLSTNGLEGEHEAPLSKIIEALGYKVNIGWTGLANHIRPELQGTELPASLFRKAGNGKVQIIPVARYSPDFELPFGYYIDSASSPAKHQVGVLAKAGTYPEHQTLFPRIASGNTNFDPGAGIFGFYTTSPSHSAYSEDVWNILQFPSHALHATRIYPLKNEAGQTLKNTYLLCFEEAKNGDYNDYVFILKNIVPVVTDLFSPLFNGRNLDGWHPFLQKSEGDQDPGNNFQVEQGLLHVNGKVLGYIITNKTFKNYHFKVEFKWGINKWPPRQNDKRDAGICYNIPASEPDSIWPKSIECQIQEGDVGDFWMLGFSTIKVNGQQNIPANHTRFVKYADGEKPYGEWNTVEVISVNGTCIHIINGVIVNVGTEASVKDGKILLQSEYSEIFYRNAKIRQL